MTERKKESKWIVEMYSGVAVHESGFSLFITDHYSRIASQQYRELTQEYLELYDMTIEDLFFEGKAILQQALVNKMHRLDVDMQFVRKVQAKHLARKKSAL